MLPSASLAFPGCSPGSRYPDTAGTGAGLSEVIGRGLSAKSGTPGEPAPGSGAQFFAPASTQRPPQGGGGEMEGSGFTFIEKGHEWWE